MTTNKFSLNPGTVLRSSEFTYTIEAVLGQGGFGITYLATAEVMVGDIPQEFRFAIKEHFVAELCERDGRTMRVEYSRPVADKVERSRRDFMREANRLKKLGIWHPNIVRINEIFEANNTAYYVMQYLGDTSLQTCVAGAGCLSLGQTRTLLEPVMEAVAMLHDNRVAHYDIKPGNIMLHNYRGAQRPVLIDFGLAKHYDADGKATSTLGNGGYTPGYAPIEQTGAIKEFSPRCDVYALAATIYFCLTGQRPPEALKARPEVLRQALTPYAPPRVVEAILRGMATLDYNRTPDVRTLAREVFGSTPAAFVEPIDYHLDDPIEVEITDPNPPRRFIPSDCPPAPTTYGPPAPREHKNSKWWLWLILAVALAAGIGAYYQFRTDQGELANKVEEPVPQQPIPDADYENLDLCVSYMGKAGYFNQAEWAKLSESERSKYTKMGLVVIGNGQRFLLSLTCYEEMTWYEAIRRYGNQLPTKAQAQAMADNYKNINSALEAYGGTVPSTNNRYWTRDEYDSSRAWSVNLGYGRINYNFKTNTYRVRPVAPVAGGVPSAM